MPLIYKNDIGDILRFETQLDGTKIDPSQTKIIVKKPSGTIAEWTPDQIEDDGTVIYITKQNDLDESGPYRIQVKVYLTDGTGPFYTDATTIVVYDRPTIDY